MKKLNPREPFFMGVTVTEKDGSIRFDAETPTGALTVEEVISQASEEIEDHGGIVYVYRCVPVKRLCAYRVKVENIEDAKHDKEAEAQQPSAT